MAHSYSGLVLSRRAVEFSLEPCCPEVPWSSFALKFSVSRGRCGIIASMRFVSSFLLLKSGRSMGLRVFVWIVLLRRLRCPEVGVGIPTLTSGHLRRDLELHVCLYFPWEPIIGIGFLRTLLLTISFSNAFNTPKTLETSRAVRAFKTFKTHSTLETLDAFETPEAPIAFETRF